VQRILEEPADFHYSKRTRIVETLIAEWNKLRQMQIRKLERETETARLTTARLHEDWARKPDDHDLYAEMPKR
jgi:ABC-type phosphate transport system auxiliary subunit